MEHFLVFAAEKNTTKRLKSYLPEEEKKELKSHHVMPYPTQKSHLKISAHAGSMC